MTVSVESHGFHIVLEAMRRLERGHDTCSFVDAVQMKDILYSKRHYCRCSRRIAERVIAHLI